MMPSTSCFASLRAIMPQSRAQHRKRVHSQEKAGQRLHLDSRVGTFGTRSAVPSFCSVSPASFLAGFSALSAGGAASGGPLRGHRVSAVHPSASLAATCQKPAGGGFILAHMRVTTTCATRPGTAVSPTLTKLNETQLSRVTAHVPGRPQLTRWPRFAMRRPWVPPCSGWSGTAPASQKPARDQHLRSECWRSNG